MVSVCKNNATTAAIPLRHDEALLGELPSAKGTIDVDVSASEETNAAVQEASRKRKRPTAFLLKKAMEDLEKIWWEGPNHSNDDDRSNSDDNEDGSEKHPDGTKGNDGTNANNDAKTVPRNTHDLRELLPPSEIDRVRQTTELLVKVFKEDIHGPAVHALVANERLVEDQSKLQMELTVARKEVERLRRSEKRSRESIQNLLKAVGESAEETKDTSQAKLVEAKIRADLLHARAERDAAHKESSEAKRSIDHLTQDITILRKDKAKLQDDKIRLESELRSARSLADSLSSSKLVRSNKSNHDNRDDLHHADELDQYKAKARELESQLQGMTARLSERDKQIQQLRRYRDKNQSQQRLEALQAARESDRSKKRSRYSIKLTPMK